MHSSDRLSKIPNQKSLPEKGRYGVRLYCQAGEKGEDANENALNRFKKPYLYRHIFGSIKLSRDKNNIQEATARWVLFHYVK